MYNLNQESQTKKVVGYFPIVVLLFAWLLLPYKLYAETNHLAYLSATACQVTNGNTPSGYVDFQVWSWDNDTLGGLNPDVLVQYQVELTNGQVSGYQDYMHGAFTDENLRRFNSTIYTTGDIKRLTLVVTVLGTWGNGHAGGQVTTLDTFPTNCATSDPDISETHRYYNFLPALYR